MVFILLYHERGHELPSAIAGVFLTRSEAVEAVNDIRKSANFLEVEIGHFSIREFQVGKLQKVLLED